MSKRLLIVSLAALLGACAPMFSGCDRLGRNFAKMKKGFHGGEAGKKTKADSEAEPNETAEKQCQKGDRYLEQENYAEAVKWYRKAAERGHAPAQCMFGFCYEMGLGVPKDVNQARGWYRKSVAQGYSLAKYRLEQLDKR